MNKLILFVLIGVIGFMLFGGYLGLGSLISNDGFDVINVGIISDDDFETTLKLEGVSYGGASRNMRFNGVSEFSGRYSSNPDKDFDYPVLNKINGNFPLVTDKVYTNKVYIDYSEKYQIPPYGEWNDGSGSSNVGYAYCYPTFNHGRVVSYNPTTFYDDRSRVGMTCDVTITLSCDSPKNACEVRDLNTLIVQATFPKINAPVSISEPIHAEVQLSFFDELWQKIKIFFGRFF